MKQDITPAVADLITKISWPIFSAGSSLTTTNGPSRTSCWGFCWVWGIPSVDFFATRDNQQCHQFCSWTVHSWVLLTDTFLLKWGAYLQYAFSLILQVIHKLRQDHVKIILIGPASLRQDLCCLSASYRSALAASQTGAISKSEQPAPDGFWMVRPRKGFCLTVERNPVGPPIWLSENISWCRLIVK